MPGENQAEGPSAGVEDRERAIEGSGFGGLVRSSRSILAALMLAVILLVVGCGGGGEEAKKAEPPPPDKAADPKAAAPAGNAPGGATVESKTNAETLEDSPFELNQRLTVPPDFRAAYQRRALIVVQFSKEAPDSTRGI